MLCMYTIYTPGVFGGQIYRWLKSVWMLATKLRSSEWTASALTLWAISLAPALAKTRYICIRCSRVTKPDIWVWSSDLHDGKREPTPTSSLLTSTLWSGMCASHPNRCRKKLKGQEQWCKPAILLLKRWRQADLCQCETSLVYRVSPRAYSQRDPV